MGSFRLGAMTIASIFKKPQTLKYPFESKAPYPGQKGHIRNDTERCILCGMCQKTCPCNCIRIDKESRQWEIEPFICIQCGSCVRVCPTKCLEMEPEYTPVSTSKYDNSFYIPDNKADKKAEE